MDNLVGVSRSITNSVLRVRIDFFRIILMNSRYSSLMILHTSVVDCPVEDVLPDSVVADLLASSHLKWIGEEIFTGLYNFISSSVSCLLFSVISTMPGGNEPEGLRLGWLTIDGTCLKKYSF